MPQRHPADTQELQDYYHSPAFKKIKKSWFPDLDKQNGGIKKLQKIMEDKQKDSPWVSVKDRLPEPHETVLVYCFFTQVSSTAIKEVLGFELNRRFTDAEIKGMGRYVHGMFDEYGFPNHGKVKYEILYWMPIPDLPEDV